MAGLIPELFDARLRVALPEGHIDVLLAPGGQAGAPFARDPEDADLVLEEEIAGLTREELLGVLFDAGVKAGDGAEDAPFYDPSQPRHPAGSPVGGRWVGGVAAGTQAARDTAHQAVRDFAAGKGPPTARDAHAIALHLARLTVAQIHALKASLGIKAGAPNKAALVAKIAQRIRALRAASTAPAAAPAADPADRVARVRAGLAGLQASGRAVRPPFRATDPAAPPPYAGPAYARARAGLDSLPVVSVPLSGLVVEQDTASPERVLHHAAAPGGAPITLVRKGGVLYIDDGIHRATAAKLAGDTTISARVLDLDAPAAAGPPSPATPPPGPSGHAALAAAVAGKVLELAPQSRDGLVPIHEVRRQVPAPDREAFDDAVRQLWRDGKVRLVPLSDLSKATRQQLADGIPGVNETFFYLEPTDAFPGVAGARTAAAQEALPRPVPAPQQPAPRPAGSVLPPEAAVAAAAASVGPVAATLGDRYLARRIGQAPDLRAKLNEFGSLDVGAFDDLLNEPALRAKWEAAGVRGLHNEYMRKLSSIWDGYERGSKDPSDATRAADSMAHYRTQMLAAAVPALRAVGRDAAADWYATDGAALFDSLESHFRALAGAAR